MLSPTATTDTTTHLSADATMDAVTLVVSDLASMSNYYERTLALEPLEEAGTRTGANRVLGRGNTPMVRLIENRNLPAANPRSAGLFHSAFLFNNESSLAATVYRAAREPRSQFVGAADHLVSEAFYFTDPEGNGIELYRDRPRSSWTVVDGQTIMDTLYLDPQKYLTDHLVEADGGRAEVMPGSVGHIHLQVGDIAQARQFYINAIGFDITFDQIESALFVSAGGYHHHMAMNVWNSRGAGTRGATLGLGDVSITVPTRTDLDGVVTRLEAFGAPVADDGRSITTRDPWNTQITVGLPLESAEQLLTQ